MNTYLTTAALLLVLVTLKPASGAPGGGSRSGTSSSHLDIDAMIDPLQPSSAEEPKESQLAQRSLFNFRVFCKEGEQHVNGRCVPVFKSSGAGGSEAAALQLAQSYYQRSKTTRKPSRRRPQGTGEGPTTTTTDSPTTTTTTIPPTTTTLIPEIHNTAPTPPLQGPHYQVVTSAGSPSSHNSVVHHGLTAPTTPEFVHELDILQTTMMPDEVSHHHHHHHTSGHHHHHQQQQQQPILTIPTANFDTTTPQPEANPTSFPPSMKPSPTDETIIKETDTEDQVPETTMMPSQSEISDTEVFATDSEVPSSSLPTDQGQNNMVSTLPPAVAQQILEEEATELKLTEGSTVSPTVFSETPDETTEAEPIAPAPLPVRATDEAQNVEPKPAAQQVQNNQPTTTPPAPPTTQVFQVFPETTSQPPTNPASTEPSKPEELTKVSSISLEKLSTTTSTTPKPSPSLTTTTTSTRQPSRPSTPPLSIFRFPEEESDDYIDETSTEIHAHPAFQPTPSSSATSTPLASIFWEPLRVDQVPVPKPRSGSELKAPAIPADPSLRPPSGRIHFEADIRGLPEVPQSLLVPTPSQFHQPADRRTHLSGGLAPGLSDYPTYPSFTAHEHFRFPVSTINTVVSEGLSRAESERRSRQLLRPFG